MGNKLKVFYYLLTVFLWVAIVLELLVLTVFKMQTEAEKDEFFFEIVSPCSEIVAMMLCLMIPIALVVSAVLLTQSISRKNYAQFVKVLVLLVMSFLFVVIFGTFFVAVTGGV